MARRSVAKLLLSLTLVLCQNQLFAQNKQKKELARIQSELRKTLAELDALRSDEATLNKTVSQLENLDTASRKKIERIKDNIRHAEIRRTELNSRLDGAKRVDGFWTQALSAEIARNAASIAARSDFYGSRELYIDEFRRAAIIDKVRHLRGLKGYQQKTEQDEAAARKKADSLAQSRAQAQAEREDRRKEYETKRAQLEQTQSKVAEASRRAKELEESAKAMTALLDKFGRAGKYRKVAGTKATLDIPQHSLPWPATGKIVTSYGREKDPELGTWTVHQGMTLSTIANAPVSAVARGRVIYAGPFRSYGLVTIVDHGSGFFSVYGNLADIAKAKGGEVKAGDVVAHASSTLDSAGGKVYFEIRRGTEALDPLNWLERR